MSALTLAATIESWPLAEPFVIARGSKCEARVIVVSVADGHVSGRGECVPYPRYGETPETTLQQILAAGPVVDRARLNAALPACAARNAIDCALWDLEAKRAGRRVPDLAGVGTLRPLLTCYTLSLDTPEAMASKARAVPRLPLLKLKLGGDGDATRMRAVRLARPDARLVADAN
jgi:L-Ala-D/L-Glu epimerase